ncbi:hypothetical protein, partial [Mumia zhuanghuii]|uniref:hypothetical protein n=2 Tax=Mumia zhuanghuii TaxID=2585211 RepID=UPI001891879E
KHTVKARSVRVAAATRPGTYWLLACADAKKKVRESHERNNCRVAKKRVTVTKRMPAGPRLPWENDGPGQMRQIDVDAKITISWKRWHTWFDSENNLADHSSATFDVSNAGQLIVSGGKPLFLRLYTFKSGTARGVRTFNEQSSCVTRSGEFRAGPESIARADGSPAAQWLVKFPHPVDSSRGVIGGALHTFRGHAPLHVDSCGDTSVSELTLEAEATHDGDVVGLDWSEDLTRVAFRHRKDLVNTQTRKLGSSADVKVVLTHRR